MNKDTDKSVKKQSRTQQQALIQKKKKDLIGKDESSCSFPQSGQMESKGDMKAAGLQKKQAGKAGVPMESPGSPGAHRKLSDASNASEDLSKDSGCPSGKLSSTDSSSEISDSSSESNKRDSPSSDNDLSWIDGRAYLSPDSEGTRQGATCAKPAADTCARQQDAAAAAGLRGSAGGFMDLMMGETAEDLVREVEDLRSENEYLKDEVEELRCEMLEMRDMFQEEEVYQLQELRLQLEQAKKTCRILQYRLRKAERRSIRVAQTGQVDGELVRSLEHDIKVAKSVSLRLYNELETVQKKNSQLEWENEVLREKTQELEVAKQVLQSEMEKARESTLKKRSIRSTVSKAEKRLSQQMEDDSTDLKCQLHFAKEELTLMCKKLTKLVSESEAMHEELSRYRSRYGDVDAAQLPEGMQSSAHTREAEVKVHLKLVEEEATLLSRRIVELEVENRGLRAEMCDLRERKGGGEEDGSDESPSLTATVKDGEMGPMTYLQHQGEGLEERQVDSERHLLCSPLQTEKRLSEGREGPVGGEQDPSESQEREDERKHDSTLKEKTIKDYEFLVALRDHACILSSAIQLLSVQPRNGLSSPPSFVLTSEMDISPNLKAQGSLIEAVELLQAMLVSFIEKMETLLRDDDECKDSVKKEGLAYDFSSFLCANHGRLKELHGEDVCTMRVKPKTKQTSPAEVMDSWKDPNLQLSLQILWILHQWCNAKETNLEGKESRDKTLSVLLGLLQDLSAELREDSKAKAAPCEEAAELSASAVFHNGQAAEANRICDPKEQRLRRLLPPHGCQRKNWCYLNQEAAQLDQEDPVKTWDHLIMPLSFPGLDFEQMSIERSHTAPEKTSFRIYYSPPSARRVYLAQLKQSPTAERRSVDTSSPWCTPPTSFSQLCLGSSANLSDDMKEMTASWRQTVHSIPSEKKGRLANRWVDVACSGTQTHTRPQMVSVGQQTDETQGLIPVRNSPSRILSPSLVSARSQHISTSLDGLAGRVERPRTSTSSPKLYRRNSSSLSSSPSLSPSSSSSSSRDRGLWNLSQQSSNSPTWTRQTSPRSGAAQNLNSVTKPPNRSSANRCGLVTEFLRRVSGRVDKAAPVSGQKTKGSLKNMERAPTRPQGVPLHRNDSVTRIVNQRFIKQREEATRTQREEKGINLSQRVRNSQSTATTEDGNYDCSSSSTLTFCFARPSRQSQRRTSVPTRLQRQRYSAPVNAAADSSCG
ncbi:protein SOGA1 [Cyprinodon tularosa]|uniref:protein SOGA1 n=1 Tax=Cyprinodon tularosa TaxID=77115 RepID=UPI0018E23BE2|nr:protein SOGA1 [Cyprinodon tularosa]